MKWFGLAIAFGAVTAIGWTAANRLQEEQTLLRAWADLGRFFATEIRYRGASIEEIWASANERSAFACVGIGKVRLSADWKERLLSAYRKGHPHMSDDVFRLIDGWIHTLGRSDAAGQVSECERFAEQMDAFADSFAVQASVKARLYRSLGISGATVLVLILV